MLGNNRSHSNEKPTHHNQRGERLHSLQLDKSPHISEDPAEPKINQQMQLYLKNTVQERKFSKIVGKDEKYIVLEDSYFEAINIHSDV